MKYILGLFFMLVIVMSCQQNWFEDEPDGISRYRRMIEEQNEQLDWQELDCGLWWSNEDDLGFQVVEYIDDGTDDPFVTDYITRIGWGDTTPLVEIIDTSTFEYLGSSFYRDHQNVYWYYIMSDGGYLYIADVNVENFEVIGDCYAKDDSFIYNERAFVLDSVDYSTFKTAKGIGCYAKDKNGYYFWDTYLNKEEMQDSFVQSLTFSCSV